MIDADHMTVFAMQFSQTNVLCTGPCIDMRGYACCSSEFGPRKLAERMEVHALYSSRKKADEKLQRSASISRASQRGVSTYE